MLVLIGLDLSLRTFWKALALALWAQSLPLSLALALVPVLGLVDNNLGLIIGHIIENVLTTRAVAFESCTLLVWLWFSIEKVGRPQAAP